MFRNYLKMAWKVLCRRKFFTFISLFGIGFTMTALLIAVALADHMLAPSYPETRLDRMLLLERMKMAGDRSQSSRITLQYLLVDRCIDAARRVLYDL